MASACSTSFGAVIGRNGRRGDAAGRPVSQLGTSANPKWASPRPGRALKLSDRSGSGRPRLWVHSSAGDDSGDRGDPANFSQDVLDAIAVRNMIEDIEAGKEPKPPPKPTAMSELQVQLLQDPEYTVEQIVGQLSRALRVPEDLMPSLLRLPSTAGGYTNLESSAKGLNAWRATLSRGLLPTEAIGWPGDGVFRDALLGALGELDMGKFTRRHPALINVLLKNVMEVLARYEQDRKEVTGPDAEAGEATESGKQEQDQKGKGSKEGSGDQQQDGEEGQESGDAGAQAGAGKGGGDSAEQQVADSDFDLDSQEQKKEQERKAKQAADAANKTLAKELAAELTKEWAPLVENLQKADDAFEGFDLGDLQDESGSFDLSRGVWRQGPWQELDSLRRKLENLRELRDLVRNLGRATGRGPLRRSPRQTAKRGAPMGVVRTPESQEETRGLTRSDDISRMLPSEAQLLAVSKAAPGRAGVKSARLLHYARRLERTLLTYERVGWTDVPAQTRSGTEVRPAAVSGPIILCLDTSGSMMGAREVVAKALALECMRQARTQKRACYLYSFSGPGDCQEFELSLTAKGLTNLFNFLAGSFHGGTDVDEPFKRSLERLKQAEWSNADILMVTDGEIPDPERSLVDELDAVKATMGLKVHALLVGSGTNSAIDALASNTHVFRSWSAVGGRQW